MKWIVLLLVVGGLVLASGPALAQQGNPQGPPQIISPGPPQPHPLQVAYFEALAEYLTLVREYNQLAEAAHAARGGVGPQSGPPFPGARQLLAQIVAQGRKVAALKQAWIASQNVPPPAQP